MKKAICYAIVIAAILALLSAVDYPIYRECRSKGFIRSIKVDK